MESEPKRVGVGGLSGIEQPALEGGRPPLHSRGTMWQSLWLLLLAAEAVFPAGPLLKTA